MNPAAPVMSIFFGVYEALLAMAMEDLGLDLERGDIRC